MIARTRRRIWVTDAVERQLGPGWRTDIASFHKGGEHWRAHVIARRGSETRELDIGDEPPPAK
jgi:hypothetical protein